MIDKILSDTDNRSKGEVNAVIATLVDWKEAFQRQCPKLGILFLRKISQSINDEEVPLGNSIFDWERQKSNTTDGYLFFS